MLLSLDTLVVTVIRTGTVPAGAAVGVLRALSGATPINIAKQSSRQNGNSTTTWRRHWTAWLIDWTVTDQRQWMIGQMLMPSSKKRFGRRLRTNHSS